MQPAVDIIEFSDSDSDSDSEAMSTSEISDSDQEWESTEESSEDFGDDFLLHRSPPPTPPTRSSSRPLTPPRRRVREFPLFNAIQRQKERQETPVYVPKGLLFADEPSDSEATPLLVSPSTLGGETRTPELEDVPPERVLTDDLIEVDPKDVEELDNLERIFRRPGNLPLTGMSLAKAESLFEQKMKEIYSY